MAAHHKAQIQEQHLRLVAVELVVKILQLLRQVELQILEVAAAEMLVLLGEQEQEVLVAKVS